MPSDNPRELIGTVTFEDGTKVSVFMPNMGDLMKAPTPMEGMIIGATGMTMEEFYFLSITDGTRILQKMEMAINAVAAYNSIGQLDKKK